MKAKVAKDTNPGEGTPPSAVTPFVGRENLGIWRRIECIMSECKRLAKTESNQDQGFDYTPYDDIAEMIRPLLVRYGVGIVQDPMDFFREGTLTRIRYQYKVVNTDRPEDLITLHNYGEGADFSDKGINKASTIAEKFFLCRLFHLSTGGDPDGTTLPVDRTSSQNGRDVRHPENGRAPDTRRPAQTATPAREQVEIRCEQCGRLVTPTKKDGEVIPVKSILTSAQKEYQKNLCADCLLLKRAQANATTAESNNSKEPESTVSQEPPQPK